MKQLNTILVLLAAMFILGCTPPERIDNSGNNSDNIENKDDDNKGDNNDDDKGDKDDDNNDDDDKGGGGEQNPLKQTTKPPYEIGDYYNENGKEGIVIEVDQDGNNGKIISLYQSPTTLQWASDSVEQNRLVGTIYMSEGVRNLAKIVEIPNWMGKYPAFKWCFDYGKGWYLPSLQEVERFLIFPAIREAINRGLTENGGTPLSDVSYWSSTEDDTQAGEGIFRAKYVNAKAMTAAANLKKYKFYVRAVASFGDWYDEIYNDIYQDIYDNPNPSPNPDDPDPDNPNPDNPNPDNPDPDNPDPDNPNDPITIINGIEMEIVKGGTFTMGSDDAEALDTEKPAHSVTVSNYYIGKYEVTQALWVAVMGSNPSGFRGDDNLPVENISWNMAMEFITKLNAITGKRYRMPTEAEWELAAREALLTQKYPYSGSFNVDEVAWYCDNAENRTHPVGQKKPNPRGIYDMSGNVFELCYDWFGMYSTAHQTNPIGPSSGTFRIMRGGSYVDNAFGCRIIYRNGLDSQDVRYINVGLRLAMSADATGPDYNDRGDWLGPDFYNPSNPNPDPDNPNPNPDDPDPDNPSPTPNPDDLTSPPYKVGDYYNDGQKRGRVFFVTDNGYSGKIVSEHMDGVAWAADSAIKELVGSYSQTNGERNMTTIQAVEDWQSRYPAFKWCADMGAGWYLPAINELKEIAKHRDILEVGSYYGLWSSTELKKLDYDGFGRVQDTEAYFVSMDDSAKLMTSTKGTAISVRAVAAFGRNVDIGVDDDDINGGDDPNNPNPDNPNPDNPDDDTPGGGGGGVTTYYVGKLVTVDGVQGIVYQTSPCVKIVTVKETTAIWCEFIDYEKTGATDADDGAKNMAIIKAIPGWHNKYPAFAWCADLGEGWYLPAKNELVDIYDKKNWINDILLSNGFDELGPKEGNSAGSVWSSTEYSSYYAYRMYFLDSFMGNYDKQYKCGVRAVRVIK